MQQNTSGPQDIIALCTDSSYMGKATRGSIKEDEDEVEGEYSHTLLSNKSEEDNESTDTEDQEITEV